MEELSEWDRTVCGKGKTFQVKEPTAANTEHRNFEVRGVGQQKRLAWVQNKHYVRELWEVEGFEDHWLQRAESNQIHFKTKGEFILSMQGMLRTQDGSMETPIRAREALVCTSSSLCCMCVCPSLPCILISTLPRHPECSHFLPSPLPIIPSQFQVPSG